VNGEWSMVNWDVPVNWTYNAGQANIRLNKKTTINYKP